MNFEDLFSAVPLADQGTSQTLDDLTTPFDNVEGGQYIDPGNEFRIRALGGFNNGGLGDNNDLFSFLGNLDDPTRFAGTVPTNRIVLFNDNKTAGNVNGVPFDADHGITSLSRVDDGLFDATSIDLAGLVSSAAAASVPVPASVTFTGTKADTSTVSQTFDVNAATFDLTTFFFNSDFAALTKLEWRNDTGGFHQFDNIVVAEHIEQTGGDPVPEPGALAIFAFGLLALGLLIRRRRLTIH